MAAYFTTFAVLYNITFTQLQQWLQQLPNLYLWAAPFIVLSICFEFFYCKYYKLPFYNNHESMLSIGIGLGYLLVNVVFGFVSLYLLWALYSFFSNSIFTFFAVWQGWHGIVNFILCFVLYDFLRYWTHRISHEQLFWWATHATHHSATEYNLLVAFRLSWVDFFKLIFFVPIMLLGFHPCTFFIVHQSSNLLQLWQHTMLPIHFPHWVSCVFVTPQIHQLHHAKNEVYIDKNYGSIFIFWDKLFGTYVSYSEIPFFGLKKMPENISVPSLVFFEYSRIWDICKQKLPWFEKFKLLFSKP